ncbi:MAG TPA: DUF3341 domain-containing protein, partial [Planctomycetaceae bacterium]|nr:DUF3341 domain-containing protein [Planctomycetaceae bacterium]
MLPPVLPSRTGHRHCRSEGSGQREEGSGGGNSGSKGGRGMTSRQLIYASFAHEKDLLEGVRALRRAGVKILDAFTPYAVHGLDRALGLRPSPLTWVCFLCAMTGATFALWFEHWSLAIDWPLNVGGKPWNSLPSDVPIG